MSCFDTSPLTAQVVGTGLRGARPYSMLAVVEIESCTRQEREHHGSSQRCRASEYREQGEMRGGDGDSGGLRDQQQQDSRQK